MPRRRTHEAPTRQGRQFLNCSAGVLQEECARSIASKRWPPSADVCLSCPLLHSARLRPTASKRWHRHAHIHMHGICHVRRATPSLGLANTLDACLSNQGGIRRPPRARSRLRCDVTLSRVSEAQTKSCRRCARHRGSKHMHASPRPTAPRALCLDPPPRSDGRLLRPSAPEPPRAASPILPPTPPRQPQRHPLRPHCLRRGRAISRHATLLRSSGMRPRSRPAQCVRAAHGRRKREAPQPEARSNVLTDTPHRALTHHAPHTPRMF